MEKLKSICITVFLMLSYKIGKFKNQELQLHLTRTSILPQIKAFLIHKYFFMIIMFQFEIFLG